MQYLYRKLFRILDRMFYSYGDGTTTAGVDPAGLVGEKASP